MIYGALVQELRSDIDAGVLNQGLHFSKGIVHFLLDYEKVLEISCEGIIAEAEQGLATLDTALWPGNIEKHHFFEAVKLVYEAVIDFANRYADLVESLAEKESSAERREELRRIARICAKVPVKPVESFREAVQSFSFVQLVPYIDSDGTAISPGRSDQYMWPYLSSDLDAKCLSLDKAQNLVD